MMEYFPIPVLQQDKRYNPYQNDVMNLIYFLKEFHPSPLIDEKAFALMEKQSEVLCGMLVQGATGSMFPMRLNKLFTLLRDAHTFAMPKDSVAYPFTIRYYEGDFYVYAITSSFPDCTGKRIECINGKSIDSITQLLMENIPSENRIKACITGSYFLNQVDFLRMIDVINEVGTVCFTFSDGSEVCIPSADGWDTHSWKKEEPFSYKITGKTCYMQFNSMIDRFTYQLGCRMTNTAMDDKISQSLLLFTDFLDGMCQEINERHISKLVVDMRYNGGGNSLLGDILLDFLGISMNDICPFKSYLRVSGFLRECYPSLFVPEKYDKMKGMLVEQKEVVANQFCDVPKVKKRFHGETVFIQGQNTFSSANLLLTLIKDNGLFPLIGTPTSQSPTCYGDVFPIQLPFTNTCLHISHSYFLRPNEANVETSLSPDIIVCNSLEDRLAGADACWKWALRH